MNFLSVSTVLERDHGLRYRTYAIVRLLEGRFLLDVAYDLVDRDHATGVETILRRSVAPGTG